jgi:phosphoglucan,water dikinase
LTPCPVRPAGETLASGQRGTPWRLQVRKADGATATLTFANFSDAIVPAQLGGDSGDGGGGGGAAVAAHPGTETVKVLVDYSKAELSLQESVREELGARLGAVAVLLEKRLGGPQDVEGCVVDGEVFIVQSRPQP